MSKALVIGAGPAGVTAAAVLAGQGFGVDIIEAKRFPRDKVCGECLSSLGTQTLRDAGFGQTLDRLSPTRLTHTRLVDRAGRAARFQLPNVVAGLTRRAMDQALLEALPADVRRHQPVRVLKLDGTTAHTTAGVIEADVVVLADGKGTLPGTTSLPPRPTGDLGLKAHYDGIELDPATIHLFALAGHYLGVAAVSDGEGVVWNLAMNVPAKLLKPGEPHDVLVERLLQQNPALRDALAPAVRRGSWQASPLPRFAPRPSASWPLGVVPVGNAAAALEPIGGEGMGLAIASAKLAADTVARHGWEPEVLRRLDASYVKLWRTRRAMCRLAAVAMSSRWSASAIVRLARGVPAATRLGMALAGKADAGSPVGRAALS